MKSESRTKNNGSQSLTCDRCKMLEGRIAELESQLKDANGRWAGEMKQMTQIQAQELAFKD